MQLQQQDNQSPLQSINTFLNSYQKLTKIQPLQLDFTQQLKLPIQNQFYIISAKIKSLPFLTRLRSLDYNHEIPLFTYPQWNQLTFQIKKFFNKKFNIHVKQLTTGSLLQIKPKQSLKIRTDYYCFHPHQVYTSILVLEKCQLNTGTLAFCKNQLNLQNYNNQHQVLESIRKQKKQIQWQYAELKQSTLIVLNKSILYGSLRNDSTNTKYFAEMRWIRHDSASSSSNSS